jgi:hypothetical protein
MFSSLARKAGYTTLLELMLMGKKACRDAGGQYTVEMEQ